MLMNFVYDFPDRLQRITWLRNGRLAFVWLSDIGDTSPRLATAKPDGSDFRDGLGHVYGAIIASPTQADEIMVVQSEQIRLWTPDSEHKVSPILTMADEPANQAAWSPNGQYFAIIGAVDQVPNMKHDQQLVIFDRRMKVVKTYISLSPYKRLSWGPESDRLTYDVAKDRPVTYFIELGRSSILGETGFTHFTYSPTDSRFTCMLYPLPDMMRLVYRDPVTNKQHVLSDYDLQQNGAGYSWLKWSPNGRYIAFDKFAMKRQNIFIYDTETGKVRAYGHPKSHLYFDSPTWSPDSSILALLCERGICYLTAADNLTGTHI